MGLKNASLNAAFTEINHLNELNGALISQKQLKNLTQHLLHINSQHASYQLTAPDYQQALLDLYAGNSSYLETLKNTHQSWRQIKQKIVDCEAVIREQDDRLAIIDYHLAELEPLLADTSDLHTLTQQYQQNSQAQELHNMAFQSHNQLRQGERTILSQVHSIINNLEPLGDTYPDLQNTLDDLNDACIKLEEAAKDMQHVANQVHFDASEQSRLDECINLFNTLARKHQVTPDNLHEVTGQLQAKNKVY